MWPSRLQPVTFASLLLTLCAIACGDEAAGTALGGVSTGDGARPMLDASMQIDGAIDGAIVGAIDGGDEDSDFGFEELALPDASDAMQPMPMDGSVPVEPPDAGDQQPRFACDSDRMNDGVCDCGCGLPDPDCGDLGCPEPGCYADACELCEGASGPLECARGNCPADFELDGACDCGCRERDPDCLASEACLEPGCSAPGCARCFDDEGALSVCEDWTCDFEQQGTDGTCNCGCGAADADCAQGQGCAEPGCIAEGCTTCRSEDGASMSCESPHD